MPQTSTGISTSTVKKEDKDTSNLSPAMHFKKDASEVEQTTHMIAHQVGTMQIDVSSKENALIVASSGTPDKLNMPEVDEIVHAPSLQSPTRLKITFRQSIDILADGKLAHKTNRISRLDPKTRQSLDMQAIRHLGIKFRSQRRPGAAGLCSSDSQYNGVRVLGAKQLDFENASGLDRMGKQ
jgi:hypothetical protein